jgi:hypothetical protein
MEVTPEINELIGVVAEAKTYLLLTAHSRGNAEAFDHNFAIFEDRTKRARAAFDVFLAKHAGKGPRTVYIELRACELGVERLRKKTA